MQKSKDPNESGRSRTILQSTKTWWRELGTESRSEVADKETEKPRPGYKVRGIQKVSVMAKMMKVEGKCKVFHKSWTVNKKLGARVLRGKRGVKLMELQSMRRTLKGRFIVMRNRKMFYCEKGNCIIRGTVKAVSGGKNRW